MISSILHASFIVRDTQRALDFYHGVLNLEIDCTRPDFSFNGAWLKVGGQQIHLLELPNPDPVEDRPKHGGHDRHTAFLITDADALIERLLRNNIPFTLSQSGRKAVFCRDPDGNALEFIQA